MEFWGVVESLDEKPFGGRGLDFSEQYNVTIKLWAR